MNCTCDLTPPFSVYNHNGMVFGVVDADGEMICSEMYIRAYADLIVAALNRCSGANACVKHVEMFKE